MYFRFIFDVMIVNFQLEIIVDPIKSVAQDISQFLSDHPEAQNKPKGDLLDVAAWSNNSVNSYLVCDHDFASNRAEKTTTICDTRQSSFR